MSRSLSRPRSVALLAVAILVLAAGAAATRYFAGPRQTPAGQPPLVHVTPQALGRIREDFNARADRVRVIALLSPT